MNFICVKRGGMVFVFKSERECSFFPDPYQPLLLHDPNPSFLLDLDRTTCLPKCRRPCGLHLTVGQDLQGMTRLLQLTERNATNSCITIDLFQYDKTSLVIGWVCRQEMGILEIFFRFLMSLDFGISPMMEKSWIFRSFAESTASCLGSSTIDMDLS